MGDPEIKVVCISPAGENLVRLACLITEVAGAAARGGLGAVLEKTNSKPRKMNTACSEDGTINPVRPPRKSWPI